MIVKVAPVSIVTGNERLGTVQEKEDHWVPVDAMLHSMVSRSTGQDGNKGAKWILVESLDGLLAPKEVGMAPESDYESVGEGVLSTE